MNSTISRQPDGSLIWTGTVTAEDAPALSLAGADLLRVAAPGTIPLLDVDGLHSANSLVAALLLGWWRMAASRGETLRVRGASASLCSVLDVYGLGWMLEAASASS